MEENVFLHMTLAVIGSIGGGAAIVTGFSAWLGKVWANRIMEKEKYKHSFSLEKMKNQGQKELEIIKKDIDLYFKVSQAKFLTLFKKSFEEIDNNYKLLVNFHIRIKDAIQPDPLGRDKGTRKSIYTEAAELFDDFRRHFELNKLYFSKKSILKINKFITNAWKSLNEIRLFLFREENGEDYETNLSTLFENFIHGLEIDLDNAREAIEEEYRLSISPEVTQPKGQPD